MRAQRLCLCLALAATTLPGWSVAQGFGTSFQLGSAEGWWGRSSLGLSVNKTAARLPCPASSLGGCEELSVTGRASFGETPWGVYGRLGATYPRTYALGADSGSGLAFGAGLSWDFSPRASATLGLDTYDLRTGSQVRSTNLGLQLRY